MRNVAVTEGDKVEAQMYLGWTVDYWPVSDLVEYVNGISEEEIDAMWKNGKMTQAKFDSFENLHERTPYKH